jgi:HEPN domain-containing protein
MPGHNEWMKKAAEDLKTAIKCLKDDDETLSSAAYHTQQCAEKTLKAYLVFKKQNFPRTHDLERLLLLCSKFDSSFTQFLKDMLFLFSVAQNHAL